MIFILSTEYNVVESESEAIIMKNFNLTKSKATIYQI